MHWLVSLLYLSLSCILSTINSNQSAVLKSCVTPPWPAVLSHLIRAVLSGSSTLKITFLVSNSLMLYSGHQNSCNLADSGTFPNTYLVVLYGINSECHVWFDITWYFFVPCHVTSYHPLSCGSLQHSEMTCYDHNLQSVRIDALMHR